MGVLLRLLLGPRGERDEERGCAKTVWLVSRLCVCVNACECVSLEGECVCVCECAGGGCHSYRGFTFASW